MTLNLQVFNSQKSSPSIFLSISFSLNLTFKSRDRYLICGQASKGEERVLKGQNWYKSCGRRWRRKGTSFRQNFFVSSLLSSLSLSLHFFLPFSFPPLLSFLFFFPPLLLLLSFSLVSFLHSLTHFVSSPSFTHTRSRSSHVDHIFSTVP